MATYLVLHEVDDVKHRLSSGLREEVFGPQGITARTFRDPNGSNQVGLIVEILTSPPTSGLCRPKPQRTR